MHELLTKVVADLDESGLAYRGCVFDSTLRLTEAFDSESGNVWVLVGFAGSAHWTRFAESPEANDGKPNALDRWSMRLLKRIADGLGCEAVSPNDRRLPLQRLALQAGGVFQSPLGLLIDAEYGLWHAYRGALRFGNRHPLYSPSLAAIERHTQSVSPCESCTTQPCLNACPVDAFQPAGFSVSACLDHLRGVGASTCLPNGCSARSACPIGAQHRYSKAQLQFHLKAFLNAFEPTKTL